MDRDLESVQQVRERIREAAAAQQLYCTMGQQKMDEVVKAVAEACAAEAVRLAKMAVKETGYGVWEDKVLKNLLGSSITYDSIRDMKTNGILREDGENGIMEIGIPVGVIAALIPSTNPTSTVMYKALIALKAGNGIIFSPHPGARECILETVRIVREAAENAGAPKGLVGAIELITMEATDTLLKSREIGLILATGGEAMVRAAYSSGNPAIGVGPGNGPAFIERTADIPLAVKHILESKTFDNGTICASEQSIVTESSIEGSVREELSGQGAYFMDPEQSEKVGRLLMAGGRMNPGIVGRSAKCIAELAGISIPQGTKVLISEQTEVRRDNPYTREKLCPVLGFFVEDGWEAACGRCIAILQNEGSGHTMTIHSEDLEVIREFALKKPVSRLLVNTPAALGGVGACTNLAPALTLGCGAVGGSSTSDNITPMHLINVRRVACGTKELTEIRREHASAFERVDALSAGRSYAAEQTVSSEQSIAGGAGAASGKFHVSSGFSAEDVEKITKAVIAKLQREAL